MEGPWLQLQLLDIEGGQLNEEAAKMAMTAFPADNGGQ